MKYHQHRRQECLIQSPEKQPINARENRLSTEIEWTALIQQLHEHAIAIEEAIETADVPEAILHQFASDCTERALERQRAIGKEPDTESWTALQAKRDWLLGKLNDEQLASEFEAVMITDTTTAWGVVRRSAQNSARSSVRALTETATSSVLWEYRLETKKNEDLWLQGRLAWLLSLWQEHGEKSIELLSGEEAPEPQEAFQIEYKLQ